jgi:TolB-like protein/Tfp pilus assembly protein PilF/predicted Ser/Thr protein kinase
MIGQTLSHYKILEKLGGGGMGVVYKAQDTKLDRLVALKFLPQHLTANELEKARFLQEARAASALDHPNICTVYEIGETPDGQMFIAMAYYEGETLKEKIERGPLETAEAINIVLQIGQGLANAHQRGVFHRDIKPANILITKDKQAKIVDFGLAKLSGQTKVTKAGTTLGTAAYMSPEQVLGEDVDYRTDIWSLGAVLYETLTGQLPFNGEYEQALLYRIMNEEPEPIRNVKADLPHELEHILGKSLAKSPNMRYQTLEEMVADLKDLDGQLAQRQPARRSAPSIAVLPFVNMSADPENEYFCDGLAEELLNALAKIDGLRVAARTSAFSFKGRETDVREIGRKLNVSSVLEGSVRKVGDRVRITVQLVSVADGYHLWSERYDRRMEDIFDVQDEISLAIVEALKVKLLGSEKAAVLKRYTANTEAYQLYLKGRFFWSKRSKNGLQAAIRCFEQAIEKDARYAPAWAGIADAYNLLSDYEGIPRRETYPKARAAVNKALEIDDGLAEAHTSLGLLIMLNEWDWPRAEKEYRLGISLNPNYATAHHWYSEWLLYNGRIAVAIQEISKAVDLDPLSPAIIKDKGLTLYYARDYDGALEYGRKTLELDPDFGSVHRLLSLAYQGKGMFTEAIAENQLWEELSGNASEATVARAQCYAAFGKRDEALELIESMDPEHLSGGNLLRGIALVYAALGENDEALTWLEKAYDQKAESLTTLKVDPKVDKLRSDPRFVSLLKKVGLEN